MRTERRTIELNGSHGEGGGALFRTALAMAALTQQPVRIFNVRGAMRRQGVTAEDLTYLNALVKITDGSAEGDEIGAEEVLFWPKTLVKPLRGTLDLQEHEKGQTPGSALIVAEFLLPVLASAPGVSQVTIRGETFNNNVLTYDAFERSALPAHREQALYAVSGLKYGGFGWGASGEVYLEVEPGLTESIQWEKRSEEVRCGIVASYSEVDRKRVAKIQDYAIKLLQDQGLEPESEIIPVQSRQKGVCLTAWMNGTDSGSGSSSACAVHLQEEGGLAEKCVNPLLEWMKTETGVDPFLADQLLMPAALAEGKTVYSTSKVTRRLITMAWVIKHIMPIKVTILGREGEPGKVSVER